MAAWIGTSVALGVDVAGSGSSDGSTLITAFASPRSATRSVTS